MVTLFRFVTDKETTPMQTRAPRKSPFFTRDHGRTTKSLELENRLTKTWENITATGKRGAATEKAS